MINIKKGKTAGKAIKVGVSPYGVAVTPDGAFLYVSNRVDHTVSVVDTATRTTTTTIPIDGAGTNLAMTPDGSKVFVVINNVIDVISTATKSVVDFITLDSAQFGIYAIAPNGSRVYTTGYGGLTTINANTHAHTTVPTATQPGGVGVTPDGRKGLRRHAGRHHDRGRLGRADRLHPALDQPHRDHVRPISAFTRAGGFSPPRGSTPRTSGCARRGGRPRSVRAGTG